MPLDVEEGGDLNFVDRTCFEIKTAHFHRVNADRLERRDFRHFRRAGQVVHSGASSWSCVQGSRVRDQKERLTQEDLEDH